MLSGPEARTTPHTDKEGLSWRALTILALLDSRAQGWSAEELAYELYGDSGTPQAIRTEMFRVRSMLGDDAVESNPYPFVAGLAGCSESGRVLPVLHEGQRSAPPGPAGRGSRVCRDKHRLQILRCKWRMQPPLNVNEEEGDETPGVRLSCGRTGNQLFSERSPSSLSSPLAVRAAVRR